MQNKILTALAISSLMALPSFALADSLVAHEWGLWHLTTPGTATIMPQVGETLPPHVNNRMFFMDDMNWPHFGSGADGMIVRKPVVWFYGDEGQDITYRVKLSGDGRIVATFPSVDTDLSRQIPQTAAWNLTLGATNFQEDEREKGMSPWYGNLYLPDANSVSFAAHDETEGFLFYEASILHDLPVFHKGTNIQFDENMPLVVSILNMPATGLTIQFDHNVPAGPFTFPPDMEQTDVENATGQLAAELESMGLFAPEARAFTNVWQKDLFDLGGRILVILPQKTYADILPATITPEPASLVRIGGIMMEVP